ncbi:unnamed protein product [Paramecium octaurelia]|uniref:Tetratricopeptide repeat protein n=1 Tax=Paramecium octaurelia TaxID=43137 RepID=A0A8S1YC96_PAROT|nr:unnamed protein product [Paramecium octaurelia]
MNKADELMIQCWNPDHKGCVQQVCFNLFCQKRRLQCLQCIKNQQHSSHLSDQHQIKDMMDYIQQVQLKCDEIVSMLSSYARLIEDEFTKLKQGILQKYQMPINRLMQLNNSQINIAFDTMLKFQESTKEIKFNIEKQSNEFIKELKKKQTELKLEELNQLYEAEQLYQQGDNLRKSNKCNEALQLLDKSIAINPNNLLALDCKSSCLRKLSQFKEAIIWADKALLLDPKHSHSIYIKARCLYCQQNYAEAIQWTDEGLAIDPEYKNFNDTKVNCLISIEKYNEAMVIIDKVLSIKAEDAKFLKLKGQSLMNLKKYDEALSFCDKALKYDSSDEMIYFIKAECLKNQKKYEQAIVCYNKALQIYPQDQSIINKKGILLNQEKLNVKIFFKKKINESQIIFLRIIFFLFLFQFNLHLILQ